MGLPSTGGAGTLPVSRGAQVGVNTYHRYLAFNTAWVVERSSIMGNRRWHNELDKIYFQLRWVNLFPPGTDITVYVDVYLVPDNVDDVEPYASYQVLCPPMPLLNPGARSFPIGGLQIYGSQEYRLAVTTDYQSPIQVQIWAIPELWYSFRQVEATPFENPT
jgi:hypothetical protein